MTIRLDNKTALAKIAQVISILSRLKFSIKQEQLLADAKRNKRWYIRLFRLQRSLAESTAIANDRFFDHFGRDLREFERMFEVAQYGQPVEFTERQLNICSTFLPSDPNEN